MQLYLDMDGVLMDFDRKKIKHMAPWEKRAYHHLPRREWTAEETLRDAELHKVMALPDFWTTMEPMPDAYLLWNFCRPYHPHVLTATPANAHYRERCTKDKLRSIHHLFDSRFPVQDFHACLRHEKRAHAMPGHVLVDDMLPNCDEWTEAGGTAILHTDAVSTIRKLQELLHV